MKIINDCLTLAPTHCVIKIKIYIYAIHIIILIIGIRMNNIRNKKGKVI